jgi:hypothetical protein
MMSRDAILKKYLTAPSAQLMKEVIKDAGVRTTQFERYFGVSKDTIRHAIKGRRDLPIKHWPLFYEWKEIKKEVSKKRTASRTKKKSVRRVPEASDRLKALLDP